MSANIQFKRGTASTFHSLNPVLLRGEPGLEIDTNKIKYGDGVTPWRNLPYGNPALEVVDGGGLFAPSFSPAPGTFSPADITGLSLWMDSDKADYVHVVNNRVSVWEDMSQTRAQFFQSNKANRPSFSNQILDQNVITFDGVNDAMIGKFDLPEEFTLVIAVKRRGEATNGKILSAYSTDGSEEMVLCGIEAGGDLGVGDGTDYFATHPTDDLVTVVYTLQYTSDGLSTRLNGLNTQAGDIPGTLQKTVLSVGADRADFAEGNFSGDIAEMVIYDKILDAASLLDVENYMMERWGIVQISHPLLEGMKAFWPLNEESGNRIDITDAEVPLTPTGSVGFEAGVIGNAANFTGGANYLTAPADFTLAGAFSVSVWFKPTAVTGSAPQIIQNWAGGMQGQMALGFGDEGNETGVVWAYVRTADDNYRVSAPDLEANRWYHVVLVFDQTGNRLLLYVDGVLADQVVTADALMSTSIPLRVGVGEQTTAPNTVAFLVDQLGIWDRVLSAADVEMLYNDELGKEDFTADLYGDNVSLLLHMDKPANAVGGQGGGGGGSSGTLLNGLTAFWKLDDTADSGPSNYGLTNNGATFGSGKIGNAANLTAIQWLESTTLTDPALTKSFSLWVKLQPKNYGYIHEILSMWRGGGSWLLYHGSAVTSDPEITGLRWTFRDSNATDQRLPPTNDPSIISIDDDQWHHIAGVLSGTDFTLYLDGTVYGSISNVVILDTGTTFKIGNSDFNSEWGMLGSVDAVGVWDRPLTQSEVLELYSNGLGTEALAGNTDPDFDNVALLLHMDGANNSTTAADASKNGTDFTANNGAVISTTQSKFGGASCYFPGANSTLTGPDVGLGTDKFTLELWFKAESGGGPQYATLFANYEVSTSSSGFGLYYNNNGAGAGGIGLYAYYGICVSTNAFTDNLWHHVAVTRDGDNCKLFVDGVLEGTGTTISGRSFSSPDGIMLGGSPEIGGRHFNGYIDEVRITKGVVRYTANFTPPTAEFPLGPIKTVTMPTVEMPLLMHFDGANESATFTNSGSLNMEFTRTGSAEISTNQSQFGGSSLYLNGSTYGVYNYLTAPYSDKFEFGTGDFTVEGWIYWNSAKQGPLISIGAGFNGPGPWHVWALNPRADQNLVYWSRINEQAEAGMFYIEAPYTFSLNQWYHVAASRVNGVTRVFVNGVQIGSAADDTNYSVVGGGNDNSLHIGYWYTGLGHQQHDGYIDEIRVIKGVGLYGANFTPPAAPFADPLPTPDLLITFDAGIEDLSANAHTIMNNNVSTGLPTAPSAGFGNAGVFNGTNSRLVIPDAPEFDLSSGPFCIELRFIVTAPGQDINTDAKILISKDQYGVSYSWGISVAAEAIRVATSNINGDWDFLVSQIISSNEWHHIALTGDGSTMKLFYDGVLVGTKNRTLTNAPADVTIGCGSYNNPMGHFPGYIDNVRIVKGDQVYTSNFTPPTASLLPPAVTPAPDLLLHFDGTNGSTAFTDSGKNQLTPVVNGNAVISTTQSKFGVSSGYFDGIGDFLKFESGPWGGWNDSDWTIEFWIWPVSVTGYSPLFLCNASLNLHLYNTGDLYLNNATTGTGGLIVSNALVTEQWQHVAVVRRDGISYLYVNGVVQGSEPVPYSNGAGTTLSIGGDTLQAAYFNGYIDELRVVKGHALYTANFTPPVAPFQNPIITITQPATGLANGLEAFWKFDDLTDSTGNGYNLVDVGYSTITPGKIGGALTVNTNNGLQYAKISNFRVMRAAGFSISCWIKSDNLSETDTPSITQGIPFGFCSGAAIVLAPSQFIAGNNICPGNLSEVIKIFHPAGGASGMDGNWHHCVGTFDGSTANFYLDGVLIGTQTGVTLSDSWITPDVYFGSGMAEYARTGQVDSAGYWTRALTESEVLALYNNGNGTETLTGGGGGGAGPITTFIDSSKHNHELTAVGNAYLNLTDIKYGSGSGEFAGGHCAIPMSPEFALGAGDFTVEFWGKLNYAANSAVFSIAPTSQEAGTYLIGFRNDPNMFGFCYDMPNFTFVSADISAQYGAWTHYAFVRLDGTLKMYVNGVQVGTANTATDFTGGTQTTAVVGRRWVDQDDYYLDGLIDDLRITKGVARYIANFNPPTKAFPDPTLVAPPAPVGDIYAENVTLLLHMDGANGSTTFTDNSYLQNTVTAQGGAVISTAQSKFGGASAYFDGMTAHCEILHDETLNLPDDFTIEFWFKPISLSSSPSTLCSKWDTGQFAWIVQATETNIYAYIGTGSSNTQVAGAWTPDFNNWTHIAVTRSNTELTLWINGLSSGVASDMGYSASSNANVWLGANSDMGGIEFTNGYIDDLRITKGVARYTADFIPPTEAFPKPFTPGVDATLLLHFDGAFDDVGKNGLTFTATGGAALSTVQNKFGGSSAYFDGQAGTLLSAPSSADFAFDGDFTVEAWIYRTGNGTIYGGTAFAQIATALGNGDATGWTLFISDGINLNFLGSTGGGWSTVIYGPATIPLNQWCHVAVTRAGGAVKIFVDGVETVTGASTDSIVSGTDLYIGSYPLINGYGQASFDGYIDELRIVKGQAVYTANFTPPTAPFTPTAAVTPADITGCDLWLDSTGDIATVNGSIVTWADKSGNGRTATPADYAPAPVVAAGDGPNGQPVVRFSGDPNVLDVSYQFNLKNSSGFIVLGQTVAPTDCAESRPERVLSFQPATGFDWQNNDGMVIHHGQNDGNSGNNTVNIYSNGAYALHAVPCPMNWELFSYVIDNNGNVRFRRNGVDEDVDVFAGLSTKAGGNLYIGHGGDFTPICGLKGDMAEIVLFDHALGEAALIGLERGIMQRWFPATAPAFPPPSLLMHFDGSNGSTTFADSSLNALSVTANGNASISTAQSKFGGASGYFDGSTAELLVPYSSALEFGTGDFTVEAWVYLTNLSSDAFVISPVNSGGWFFGFDGNLHLGFGRKLVAWDLNVSTSTPTNAWTHLVVSRENGTLRLFINGVKSGEMFNNSINYSLENGGLVVGSHYGYLYLNGYIDELRIVKGVAVYTSNFTPPTAPFPNPTSPAPALLMHFDGVNGSATFTDSSLNALSVTANGNAVVSTDQSKFGGTSGFLGQHSWLSVAYANSLDFGYGPFTVEMWVYPNSFSTNDPEGGCSCYASSSGDDLDIPGWGFESCNGNLNFFIGIPGDVSYFGSASQIMSLGVWQHVAATRDANGVVRLFLDGVEIGSVTNGSNLSNSSETTIGGRLLSTRGGDGRFRSFDGYIDELRIVKGKAVYTSNFTPPTAPFPDMWTPAQLGSSLSLWLDADDSDSVVAAGGAVSQWSDKSGQNNHATPSLSSYSPNVSANGLNGRDAISFTKSSVHHLITPTISGNGIANYQSISIIQVIVPTTGWFNTYCSSVGTRNSGGSWWSFQRNNASNEFGFHGAAQYWSGFNISGNAALLVDVVTGGSTLNSWANGSQVQNNLPIGPFTSSTSDPMVIGAGSQVESGEAFDGMIAEIIFLPSAISNENRQKIEGYLAWKWGLVSSLPSDHPYKTSFPTTP